MLWITTFTHLFESSSSFLWKWSQNAEEAQTCLLIFSIWHLTLLSGRQNKVLENLWVHSARILKSFAWLSSSTSDGCLLFSSLSLYLCWNLFWLWKHFRQLFSRLLEKFSKVDSPPLLLVLLKVSNTLQLSFFLWVSRWNGSKYWKRIYYKWRTSMLWVVSHFYLNF